MRYTTLAALVALVASCSSKTKPAEPQPKRGPAPTPVETNTTEDRPAEPKGGDPEPKPANEPVVEARLRYLAKQAKTYYETEHTSRNSPNVVTMHFPAPNAGPTPVLGSCCAAGGKCAPELSQWDTPVWKALDFDIAEAHYFSYTYSVNDNPGATDGSNSFTVTANGDLDCDGEYSTYEIRGVIDSKLGDGVSLGASIAKVRPLE